MRNKMLTGLILAFLFLSMPWVKGQAVVDHGHLLAESTENQLMERSQEIKEEYALDPVIVTIKEDRGKSSRAYADDYFDYNGYGVGKDHDGILMLINMDQRDVWISTTGESVIKRYDPFIDKMLDEITPFLSDGDYDQAGLVFLEMVENVEKIGKPFPYLQRVGQVAGSWVPLAIALGMGFIFTFGLTYSSKSRVTSTGRTYESGDSFVLAHKEDRFEREHTSRTKIPKNNTSGGGSHTGSSGRSHGGGGSGF